MLKDHFQLIDKESVTPEDLVEMLDNRAVFLELKKHEDIHECAVSSVCLSRSGEEVLRYYPRHYLAVDGTIGEEDAEADTPEEWRKIFNDSGSWISIDCEELNESAEDPIVVCTYLAKTNNEVYVSYDRGNFYGPLEIQFIELWLKEHEDYIL